VKVYVEKVVLISNQKPLRQIIIIDHGRAELTSIVIGNFHMDIVEVLTIYAKRWHIKNKLS